MLKKFICLLSVVAIFSCSVKEDKVYEYSGSRGIDNSIPKPGFVTEDLYEYSFENWGEKSFHTYTIMDAKSDKVGSNKNFLEKIESVKPGVSELNNILDEFGYPTTVLLAKDGGGYHLNIFYDEVGLYFGPGYDVLIEIRFESNTEYKYKNEITYGTSLEKLLEILPSKGLDESGVVDWTKDSVLFTNLRESSKYISYSNEGVRIFLWEDKVVALYLF